MSSADLKGSSLQNAQQRLEILAHNTEAFLLEPELLSTVLEELAVVLEEVQQQYEELVATRQWLEAQRRCYQELFDFAPDGYLVTNAEGIIQEANQAAARLFGIRQFFLVGKPLVVFIAKSDRRAFLTYITALQTSAQQRNWDFRCKPRHGDVFPAVITTSAIRNPEGTLMGWRWLVRDITELRQAAVVTRESVIERRLADLRSNFIQTVSHELRTPMTVILTSAALLSRSGNVTSDDKKQAYYDRIQQAIWRMNTLINDVLLYDDAELTDDPLVPTLLDLESFCQTRVGVCQRREGERHTVTLNSQGDCATVPADEMLIEQILDRLLSNAVTYSPIGSTVQVALQCERNCTVISVQNEGTYIPPEQQAKLFEPFYRSPEVGHITGSGLGLAITKKAVDRYGGEVKVESSVETGVTFAVTLPRLKVDESGGRHPDNREG